MAQFRVPVLETFCWQEPVSDKDLTAPPGSPARGNRYLVPIGATGAWAGQDNDIAWYDGVSWQFDSPSEGWRTHIKDEDADYNFNGTTWSIISITDVLVKASAGDATAGYLDAKVDNTTVEVASNAIQVKNLGIDTAQLADAAVTNAKIANDAVEDENINANVAGNGLGQDGNGALEVNVDGSTIEIATDTLQVKAGGITDTELSATYIKADGSVAFSGNQSMGSQRLTNVAAPVNPNDVVRLADLNNLQVNLTWKDPVNYIVHYVKSTAGAPTGTALNGEMCLNTNENKIYTYNSGWGSGSSLVSEDRFIFAITGSDTSSNSGTYTADNKIYEYNGSSVDDTDPGNNWAAFVEQASYESPADSAWTYNNDDTIWVRFTGGGQIVAGDGLSKTGNTLNVLVDNASIQITTDTLSVKPDGVNKTHINADIAGDGLVQATGGELDVNVDDSTIEIVTDALQVKNAGIGTDKLANDAVDKDKINADIAGLGLVQAAGGELDVNVDDTTIEIVGDTLQVKAGSIGPTHIDMSALAGDGLSHDVSNNELDVNVDGTTIDVVADTLQVDATKQNHWDTAWDRRAQYDTGLGVIIFDNL